MRLLRGIGKWLWRFMVIFSFIVNFVLIGILLLAGLFIFQIKDQVADPLIGGLHSTAAGLGEATIDWTIPVDVKALPVNLSVPINANTITSQVTQVSGQAVQPIAGETLVTLTRPVPITIRGAQVLSSGGDPVIPNATVIISLPAGLELPVALNMEVAVESAIPVQLDVRAVIPLSETQLADPIETLGLLFEPLAIGLYNLPNNFNEAGAFVGAVLKRDANTPWADHISHLLLSTDGTGFNTVPYDAWVGYSRTAGLDYELASADFVDANQPMETGLVPPGGIPALDSQIDRRASYYQDGERPADYNAATVQTLTDANIPDYTWNGGYGDYYFGLQNGGVTQPLASRTVSTQPDTTTTLNNDVPPSSVGGRDVSTPTPETDSGMIPTPSSP